MLFQEIANGNKVAKGFCHFFALHREKARVHPKLCQRMLSRNCFHLGYFSIMVRKDKIPCSSMNVILLAKKGFGNGGVFNVPARPALAPGTFPFWFLWF